TSPAGTVARRLQPLPRHQRGNRGEPAAAGAVRVARLAAGRPWRAGRWRCTRGGARRQPARDHVVAGESRTVRAAPVPRSGKVTAPWIALFTVLWLVVLLLAIVQIGLLRRLAPLLENAERSPREFPGPVVGAMVPEVSITCADGSVARSTDLRGRPV